MNPLPSQSLLMLSTQVDICSFDFFQSQVACYCTQLKDDSYLEAILRTAKVHEIWACNVRQFLFLRCSAFQHQAFVNALRTLSVDISEVEELTHSLRSLHKSQVLFSCARQNNADDV